MRGRTIGAAMALLAFWTVADGHGLAQEAGAGAQSPLPSAVRSYPKAFRSDAFDIPLQRGDGPPQGAELEFKVHMRAGDALIYSWTVSGLADPDDFYFDFHAEGEGGHNAATPQVVEYQQDTGIAGNGLLVAPIDGIHGWFLQNQSSGPVAVHLRLAGFYDLIPAGEDGNEAGILPLAAGKP